MIVNGAIVGVPNDNMPKVPAVINGIPPANVTPTNNVVPVTNVAPNPIAVAPAAIPDDTNIVPTTNVTVPIPTVVAPATNVSSDTKDVAATANIEVNTTMATPASNVVPTPLPDVVVVSSVVAPVSNLTYDTKSIVPTVAAIETVVPGAKNDAQIANIGSQGNLVLNYDDEVIVITGGEFEDGVCENLDKR